MNEQPTIMETSENQGKPVADVVKVAKNDKPKRVLKPKIETVQPTHIVDVYRLVRESQIEGRQPYPDTTEERPEIVQSHLYQYLADPLVTGLIARFGRKPIGIVLGRVIQRPYGSPKHFAFIWCFWVTPDARKTGVGQQLWSDYCARLKNAGIFHWEAQCHEELEKYLARETGVPVKKLMSIIGGRL